MREMPIYEFECQNCLKRFDVLVSYHSSPIKECIYCHSAAIKKMPSLSSFQLKGSGWYLTDYKKTANREPVSKESKKAAATETKTKHGS